MFMVSWKLSFVAFVSVPIITVMSKVYGNYIRRLTKLTQKKLADANSVSESLLSTMATVRGFGAERSEMEEYKRYIEKYIALNNYSAFAFMFYSFPTISLPQLVSALVLFYGGMLIQEEELTGGELVSFLLYLGSLSEGKQQQQ
jgi:ABC-type multidrug transport system fused ATPase/permease subunit